MLIYVGLAFLFVVFFYLSNLFLKNADIHWKKHKTQTTAEWHEKFSGMFIFWQAEKVFFLYIIACLVAPFVIYNLSQSMMLTLCMIPVCAYSPKIILSLAEKRRRNTFHEQLPDSLLQIAGSMRSGSSLVNAFAMVHENSRGPISQEFGLIVREYRVGQTLEQALQSFEKRLASDNVGLLVTTARIAHETGGNLAESLERLSESLRQKNMIEKKIKSLTSQGKLQGWVVGLLPVGIALVLSKIESEAMSMLIHSLFGYITIFIIIILEIAGLMMIRKIVNIDV